MLDPAGEEVCGGRGALSGALSRKQEEVRVKRAGPARNWEFSK